MSRTFWRLFIYRQLHGHVSSLENGGADKRGGVHSRYQFFQCGKIGGWGGVDKRGGAVDNGISVVSSMQWCILGYARIHTSWPCHGYSMQGAYRAWSGPGLCHSVITCTVARVEENVYNSCGLIESLVYSLETYQRMHSRAVPCYVMASGRAIALARRTYMLIHELSQVTSH